MGPKGAPDTKNWPTVNVRRWKTVPKDWWRDSRQVDTVHAIVNCLLRELVIALQWSVVKECKNPRHSVTNRKPNMLLLGRDNIYHHPSVKYKYKTTPPWKSRCKPVYYDWETQLDRVSSVWAPYRIVFFQRSRILIDFRVPGPSNTSGTLHAASNSSGLPVRDLCHRCSCHTDCLLADEHKLVNSTSYYIIYQRLIFISVHFIIKKTKVRLYDHNVVWMFAYASPHAFQCLIESFQNWICLTWYLIPSQRCKS
jgi:hypothetical protein